MSNLGDLLDDYEPERLARLKAYEELVERHWKAMTQETRDRITGVNAMIDEEEDNE